MRIGVLGTGDVGRALGTAFVALGHEVRMGSRTAGNDKARAWVAATGARASEGTFADAAEAGEAIVIATLGVATLDVIRAAGPARFAGKLVLDTTNPLDFSRGMPPTLSVGHTDSLGEEIQRLLPAAKVVKAFNTVGSAWMFRPTFAGGPPDMFICGNDAEAKQQVAALLTDFGWGTVDVGAIDGARYLEPMCLVWVRSAALSGSWAQAFKMLRG